MYKIDSIRRKMHPVCVELRRIRTIELRISQTELAAMVGVSKDCISKHEVGRRWPDAETLARYDSFIARWKDNADELRKARWRR